MKKHGMMNREIASILARLGHTDTIVIADCGLPVPNHVPCIDVSLEKGYPSFMKVFQILLDDIEVERFTLATEIKENNEKLYKEMMPFLQEKGTTFLNHANFKKATHHAKAIIRTGEATPYANIILHAGVIF